MSRPALALGGLLALALLLRLWLARRQIAHLRRLRSASAAQAATADYAAAGAALVVVAAALEALLILALTLGGGIAALDPLWRGSGLAGGGMVASVMLTFALLRAAVGFFQSVVVDARFGLVRMAPARVAAEALKVAALRVGVAAVAGELLAGLIATGRADWWLWAAVLWSGGLIGKAWLSPELARRLFGRSDPLPPGLLNRRLTALLGRCGLGRAQLCVTSTAPRSRRANARLAGSGSSRRIELSDTLIDLLTPAEIEAVVAHEAGHWRRGHVSRDLAAKALLSLGGFAALALLMQVPVIARGLHVPPDSTAAWLAAAAALLPLPGIVVTPAAACWRRRLEYEADVFAARHADPRALARALEKLYATNATVLSSDRLYAGFYSSHPPPAERLRRLDALAPRDATAAARRSNAPACAPGLHNPPRPRSARRWE